MKWGFKNAVLLRCGHKHDPEMCFETSNPGNFTVKLVSTLAASLDLTGNCSLVDFGCQFPFCKMLL